MAKDNRKRSTPDASKRVAIYARRSKADKDTTISLPQQEAACRKYAGEQGWGRVVVVKTENRSGVTGSGRPVFMDLIAAGLRQEFEILLTLDMSRFGRFDANERGHWIYQLESAGVEVRHVMDDSRLEGEAGPIMGAVLQTGQREHSVKTAYKVTLGALAAAERGCWPGGTAPFGFRLERRADFDGTGRRDAKLVVVPNEADVVRSVFQLRAEQHLGYATLARRLNAKGTRTKRGRLWTGTSIRSMLENALYYGLLVRGRGRGAHTAKFYNGSLDGPVPIAAQGGGYEFEGIAPPIVSKELWDQAQHVAAEHRRKHGARPPGIRNSGKHLLSHLTTCGACGGSSNVAEGSSTKTRRFSYYVCAAKARGAEHREECRLVRAQSAALEDRILDQLRTIAGQIDPQAVSSKLRERLKRNSREPTVDITALERKRTRLKRRRRDLLLSDDEFVRDGVKDLAEEDARLAQEIEVAKRRAKIKPFDVEQAVQRAVAAACALAVPKTEAGRQATKALLQVFVPEIKIMPSPKYRAKAVELTVRTPEGLGELFISKGCSSTP